MNLKKMEEKIRRQKKSQKFLSMSSHVAFNSTGNKIVAYGSTETQAEERAIIKGEDFPIVLGIRDFFPSLIHKV